MIDIVSEPIDVATLVGQADGGSGGLVLFVGQVRASTGGRNVVRLEYEAYRAMALAELEKLAEEAARTFAISGIDIVHRVGTLAVGDIAVAIVVRAPHRAAAFDACRWAIDTLKRTVPIWKKEVFEDGSTWVGDRP
jgi:molybdopterin synthase catalytic subunit